MTGIVFTVHKEGNKVRQERILIGVVYVFFFHVVLLVSADSWRNRETLLVHCRDQWSLIFLSLLFRLLAFGLAHLCETLLRLSSSCHRANLPIRIPNLLSTKQQVIDRFHLFVYNSWLDRVNWIKLIMSLYLAANYNIIYRILCRVFDRHYRRRL